MKELKNNLTVGDDKETATNMHVSRCDDATDIVLGIQDVLIRHGKDVEWSITYDPAEKKWTVTVKNPSIHV